MILRRYATRESSLDTSMLRPYFLTILKSSGGYRPRWYRMLCRVSPSATEVRIESTAATCVFTENSKNSVTIFVLPWIEMAELDALDVLAAGFVRCFVAMSAQFLILLYFFVVLQDKTRLCRTRRSKHRSR